MPTIWKFPLTGQNVNEIVMPKGAQVLCVQTQGVNLEPCLWAIVDPVAPDEVRRFAITATGGQIPENPGKYIGTFQMFVGSLVFHVFEICTPVAIGTVSA